MKTKKWYWSGLFLAIVGIVFVVSLTSYGFAKYNDLKSLVPMGWAISIIFIVYMIWDIVWVILSSKEKILCNEKTKVLKYIIIILQVFTLASIYLGIAIGGLF